MYYPWGSQPGAVGRRSKNFSLFTRSIEPSRIGAVRMALETSRGGTLELIGYGVGDSEFSVPRLETVDLVFLRVQSQAGRREGARCDLPEAVKVDRGRVFWCAFRLESFGEWNMDVQALDLGAP